MAWAGALLCGALTAGIGFAVASVRAQSAEVVWYRVVAVPGHAMERYQRLDQPFSGTISFMEGFEINIRPEGEVATVTISDGASRTTAAISCTRANAPRRVTLQSTRTTPDTPTVVVDLRCSATEPPVR